MSNISDTCREQLWVTPFRVTGNCLGVVKKEVWEIWNIISISNTSFLVGNQLDRQFLLWYVYLNPLHVLSNYVLILRRTVLLIQHLVLSLCARVIIPDVVLVQLSSWGWAHSCSKHVEDLNKHIIEENVHQVGHLPDSIHFLTCALSNSDFFQTYICPSSCTPISY